jgi:hypothetical protein
MTRQAVGYISMKEVKHMPITLTLHIFGYTVTIKVKKQDRHSGK